MKSVCTFAMYNTDFYIINTALCIHRIPFYHICPCLRVISSENEQLGYWKSYQLTDFTLFVFNVAWEFKAHKKTQSWGHT